MAISILCALLSGHIGKCECAPIGDATDYTAGAEDDVAGRSCDARGRTVLVVTD